jgi:enoyl-CoA hydratase
MPDSEMIAVERHHRVGLITLDRPEKRNAIDTQACTDLASAVVELFRDGARALVLAGSGPDFCSGADLRTVEDDDFVPTLYRMLDTLRTVPVATIATVQGAALGGGTQLAIACDLRVVAPDARFGIPAARLGLMVDHWSVQRLAMLAGYGPARGVLLACDEIDADSALRLGLANRPGGLDVALEWAGSIAALAPLTIAGHKLALNSLETGADSSDTAGGSEVEAAFRRAWASSDLAEGQRARAEKRPPEFEGR